MAQPRLTASVESFACTQRTGLSPPVLIVSFEARLSAPPAK